VKTKRTGDYEMEQQNNNIKRKWKQITEKERYKIEAYIEQGMKTEEIGIILNKSKRTIEREIKIGMVEQKRENPSNNKNDPLHIIEMKYKADTAQMRREKRAKNKGRNLKIGKERKLVLQ
jgi:IS30 family transposase